MTDNQPEVVATADLTPASPKPINLSSPALVPTLQDQAENLYTMSLSPPVAGPPDPDASTTDQQPWAHGQDQNPSNYFAELTQAHATASNENNGWEEVQDGTHAGAPDVDGDEYAKNFDSPEAVAEGSQQEDTHKVNEPILNTDASDLLKNQPVMEARSDSLPSTLIQFLQESTSKSIPEPNQPVADSHPNANGEPAMSLVQASPTAVATVSDNAPTESVVQAEDAIDIQALVDNITARAAASESNQTADSTSDNGPSTNLLSTTQSVSLPPRPPSSQQPTSAHLRAEERKFQPGASHPNAQSTIPNMPPVAGTPYPYPAPGTVADIPGSHPPSVMSPESNIVLSMPMFNPSQAPISNQDQSFDPQQQQYDNFLQEERKYVSEAKWDRFPDGSRLFIGNLSSERVSKREVFDIFSRYGRLAQISLKQAYGFVQYHAVTEGQAAMDNLQGTEIRGRKIHLEFSRAQKKNNNGDGDGDRQRGSGRGRGGRDHNDRNRYDGRQKDDYRRARSPSPAHGHHHRQNSYGRDRGRWDPSSDHARHGRSRSPPAFGGSGGYRRRSDSPYRRAPPTEADLDIPRRYAGDVPDVQLLLLQEVDREFVDWIQRAFVDRGLKVDVMFLNPRLPRELVIQRQVVEGVHGVSELDNRAQMMAKIPLQVFDRSAGRQNARFDQYQDLDPKIAAELVTRAKASAQTMSPALYGGGQFPPAAYPPMHQPQQPQYYAGQPPPNGNFGALGNLAHLDPATLQKVLAAVQGQSAGPGQQMGAHPGVDINAVLGALGASSQAPARVQQLPGYGPGPAGPSAPPSNPADQAHVQNIMAQLSRYRQ